MTKKQISAVMSALGKRKRTITPALIEANRVRAKLPRKPRKKR